MEIDEKIKAKTTEIQERLEEIDRIYKTVEKDSVEDYRLEGEQFELSCTIYRLLNIPSHATKEYVEQAIKTISEFIPKATIERDMYISQGNDKAVVWYDASKKVVDDSLAFLNGL